MPSRRTHAERRRCSLRHQPGAGSKNAADQPSRHNSTVIGQALANPCGTDVRATQGAAHTDMQPGARLPLARSARRVRAGGRAGVTAPTR